MALHFNVVYSLLLSLLTATTAASTSLEEAKSQFQTPDTFDIEYPDDVEPTGAQIELGKKLFFDKKLSLNESQSCATCHDPDHGFSDGLKFSLGAMGNASKRNAPHLYNLAWNILFLWDGRAASLEEQALIPIEAPDEMNLPLETLVKRLSTSPEYEQAFTRAYGDSEVTTERIAHAIASFERGIIVDDTPFDRYLKGNDNAISDAAKRGLVLFAGKGKCIDCHSGPNFTDNSFHNIGLASNDPGRGEIIGDDTLDGAFKVPGLRNIIFSAPYMHDGSLGTLEEVVQFYNRGGDHKEQISELIKPLELSDEEVRDLVAFLASLNQPLPISREESERKLIPPLTENSN